MKSGASEEADSPRVKVVSDSEPLRLNPPETESPVRQKKPLPSGERDKTLLRNLLEPEKPQECLQDDETEWGSDAGKTPAVAWFLLAVILLIGIGLWATFSMYNAQGEIEEVSRERKELAENVVIDKREIQAIQQGMTVAVRDYLAATDIEEKLKHVRHPERVKPLMGQFYKKHELRSLKFLDFANLTSLALESRPFIMAEVVFEGGKKSLLIEQLSEGRFVVDWEMDVYFQPMEWNDFLKNEPKQAVDMRLLVSRDNFYAYEFRDEKKYQCYRLTDRSHQQHVFAYVERGSSSMVVIEQSFADASGVTGLLPLILRIRYPEEGTSKRCVIIDQIMSVNWAYASPPKDADAVRE